MSKEDKFFINLIIIMLILVIIVSIAQYKIAISDEIDPWIKFWLLR